MVVILFVIQFSLVLLLVALLFIQPVILVIQQVIIHEFIIHEQDRDVHDDVYEHAYLQMNSS